MSNETNANTDFIKWEHDVLRFWEEHRCFQKLREKNSTGPRFRFLDGPITANNPMGIHHAWGRSIKDAVLRYKAMRGYSCLYRNGFDTQGLWVEVEVEKELGFRSKKDIEAYGVAEFTRRCVERIRRCSALITEQSKRLGQWMDWDNSYYTHTDENIAAIWFFLKRCHEKGMVSRSLRPMPWCPRCGTSLSEHEMAGSHRDVTHTAVYAIAPAKGADFDFLVWTTTPWTLAANTALAVNPDLDYAVVRLGDRPRPLVMAKASLKRITGEKTVLRLLPGRELLDREYETFFPDLDCQKPQSHRVIPWGEVSADEGSGIVHIAPGCGAEDFELGKSFSLPAVCPVDEGGVFSEGYDFLTGLTTAEAAPRIFDRLQEQGKLLYTHPYTHPYPVCWRCKTEVLFRLVDGWQLKTDMLRPALLEAAGTVRWEPDFIGKRMADWLRNMGDWNISRKRYYGLPLPFYPCPACGHLTVVGSREELRELAGEQADSLPELHRPWIDGTKIRCPHCGELVSRVPEVGDVWLDAGIAPFSTLGYFENREEWERNFPAEWVIEMQEQVRLWFYAQLFMSVVLTGRAPYERVLTNNWLMAEDGTKFSKTGFMIRFDEAAERLGSDTIRYLFTRAPMGSDVRFGYTLGEDARRKLLNFWNIAAFFLTYAALDRPADLSRATAHDHVTDRWLSSRIAVFTDSAAACYEDYRFPELIREFEVCVDDVSNWYIRVNRRRFWKNTLDADKKSAYAALYTAIRTMAQVMAPVIPFLTEHVWQQAVLPYGDGEESVHLSTFPAAGAADKDLLRETETVRAVVSEALKLRSDRDLKVRQPLGCLYLGAKLEEICRPYGDILRRELNVRELRFLPDFSSLGTETLSLNFQEAGPVLKGDTSLVNALCQSLGEAEAAPCLLAIREGREVTLPGYSRPLPPELFTAVRRDYPHIARSPDGLPVALDIRLTDELKTQGLYREILRSCQLLRREAGFSLTDRVLLEFETDSPALQAALREYGAELAEETLSLLRPVENPRMVKRLLFDSEPLTVKIAGDTL